MFIDYLGTCPRCATVQVMAELAEGRGDWSVKVQEVSKFGELPVLVARELIQHIAASNDGSMKQSREYLEYIVEELIGKLT